jgi:hypothetical protein
MQPMIVLCRQTELKTANHIQKCIATIGGQNAPMSPLLCLLAGYGDSIATFRNVGLYAIATA